MNECNVCIIIQLFKSVPLYREIYCIVGYLTLNAMHWLSTETKERKKNSMKPVDLKMSRK